MKSLIKVLLIVFPIFGSIGCKKIVETPAAFNPPSITYHNTAPQVTAGSDIYLTFPNTGTFLNGLVWDLEHDVRDMSWRKISGPDFFEIDNKNSAQTKLRNLTRGEYQFELTVIDAMNLEGRDTVKVTVGDLPTSSRELLFRDRTWVFPWYASLEIDHFHNSVPLGTSFRVFIQRKAYTGWIEATPAVSNGSYEYFIESRPDGAGMYNYGSLYIFYYGPDVSDTPDVKIVF